MLRLLLIYVMVWWLVLFMALPFKAKAPERPGQGHAASAPEKPYLGIKLLVTTILSALLTAGIVYALRTQGAW